MRRYIIILLVLAACAAPPIEVSQWTTYEILLSAEQSYQNPYADVDLVATFINNLGDTLVRPGFWDGDNQWKVRFSPPRAGESWTWNTRPLDSNDKGLIDRGTFKAVAYKGSSELLQNGLLSMSKGKRNVVHQSGKSFLVVGDTPWALPFRATTEQVNVYAQDRQNKGFNTALLMSLQPDMEAEGPNARNTELGFARAFDDLSEGTLKKLNPEYFQYLDSLVKILIDHQIVPAYQPVFHGYGWKGQRVLGKHIKPSEYVRYCRYLLARYGSQPAMWLLAADNGGKDPGVMEAGKMLQKWDCYAQPAGLHYNPCDDYLASWAENDSTIHCMHFNKSYQDQQWLDFQWAQTGHSDKHLYHKVSRMYDNQPTKAVANGEPTYEGMSDGQMGLGWWQGEEAWMQLMSGGTMGVVYGAAALWQWKITAEEPGWASWASQGKSWRQAMEMEGSKYVGLVGKILQNYDLVDIEKRWDLAGGKPLLAKEDKFYLSFLNGMDTLQIADLPNNLNYHWINPKNGEQIESGPVSSNVFVSPDENPRVLIID